MKRPGGIALLIAVLLSILMLRASRVTFSLREESPAFYVNKPGYVTIYLGQGFRKQAFKQFIDGVFVSDVIQMAGYAIRPKLQKSLAGTSKLCSGEVLEIVLFNAEVIDVRRFFMHAGQCITLGIPLHPDTMNASDWQALPGIGPRLAERIVLDRQKNGDFGCLQALERVKGIGKATVKRLSKYF